jgi:hypothetical protein
MMVDVFCAECGRQREAGAMLLVVDRMTGEAWHACRPTVAPWCLGQAGPRDATAIAYADVAAAMEFDRRRGGSDPPGATHTGRHSPSKPSDRRQGVFDIGTSREAQR